MFFVKLIIILLTAIEVQVELLDGTSRSGELKSIEADTAVLVVDGAEQRISLDDVVGITNLNQKEDRDASQGGLLLHDGSAINSRLNEITAREVTVESDVAGAVRLPRPAVRAILLSPPNPSWTDAWQEFLQRKNQEDLLILMKRDGSGLDFYGGVISATADDHIDFVLDGDTVPVPRNRIYGLIFPASQQAETGAVVIQLADNSELTAKNLTTNGEALQLETLWKQTISVPLNSVRGIDFSSGRFHYLSDLNPVKESYFGIHPKGSPLEKLLQADDVFGQEALKLWQLHRDKIPMGPYGPLPLKLRGKVYRKGIWLFPHCRIDYALDGKYSAFESLVGVDDEVAFNCSEPDQPSKVEVTIFTDGDEAWKQLIEAPADPAKIKLDVNGVQTLSIEVNFGDDDSACDFLDLADARLLVVP